MATRKTYINSDEELVIKGALTIEGNVTQVETTETINRLQTDQFIINSDGDAVTAKLSLTGTGTDVADISYNTSSNVVTFNKDITATNFQGDLVGSSSNTTQFTSAVTVALTGDVTGSATFIGAGNTASISTTIQPNSVALGTDTTGNYLAGLIGGTGLTVTGSGSEGASPTVKMDTTGVTAASYGSATGVATFTVNGLGQLTTASTTPIQIATSQITSLETVVEGFFSAQDNGGDGSLSYSNGVFTYTGPSASEVRAHLSAGTGINYSSGVISTNDSQIDIHNLSGYVANENIDHSTVSITAGDGLSGGGTIASTRNLAVDSSVIRTTGSQTISGNKTFSGNQSFTGDVDLSGAGDVAGFTVDGDLVVTGDITVTTLNASQETTSNVEAANLTLRDGATTDADAQIFVEGAGAGPYPNLKWNSSGNRWQFSNNGSAYNNMLLLSDITGGAGLTFGSGDIAVGAGYGITVNANNIELANTSVRELFALTDAGGDGSMTYNNNSGVFVYNGPTSVNYRLAMQGQDGIDYSTSSGNIAVDNTVARTTTNLTAGDGLSGGGTLAADRSFAVDSTVIRTTGDQSLAGTKTFTGKVILPSTDVTDAGAIFTDSNEAWVYVDGTKKQITPTSSVGTVEGSGSGSGIIGIYGGSRLSGTVTYHKIRALQEGTYTTLAEASNVVTVDANITAIRSAFSGTGSINYNAGTGQFSFTDADRSDATIRGLFSAIGDLAYNSSTGAFTYNQRTDATIRGLISGTGLIGYNSGTGAISTTADNYANWNINTDTNSAQGVGSGVTMKIEGGSGITTSHSGTTVTIAADNVGDITSVSAGTGLTGGGLTGALTINAVGGTGITVNANNIEANMSDIRASIDGSDLDMSGNKVLFGNMYSTEANLPSASTYHGMFAHVHATGKGYFAHNGNWIKLLDETSSDTDDLSEGSNLYHTTARARAAISATAPLSYNSSTGVISLTESGDISAVNITAGTGLSGTVNTGVGDHNQTLSLKQATASERGGIQVGYSENGKNYPVELSSEKAFVNVPWTDTNNNDIDYINAASFNTSSGVLSLSGLGNAGATVDLDGRYSTTDTNTFRIVQVQTGPTTHHQLGDSEHLKFRTGDDISYAVDTPNAGDVEISVESATANTASKIVKRDSSGNFSAGTITADLTGTADIAERVHVTATNDVNQNLLLVFTGADTGTNTNAPLYKHSPVWFNSDSDTLNAPNFSGVASSAKYADLGEKYVADKSYEPGTVLVIGGEHEVTESDEAGSYKVVGVVSTSPAYLMNSECEGEHVVSVALRGRVPCKVIGNVNKGDVLIASDTPGYAMVGSMSHTLSPLQIVGRAISSKLDAGNGVVEIIV